MRIVLLLLSVIGAAHADWPCWRGPAGSGVGSDNGQPLVDDLKDARLVWRSEARDLPGTAYSSKSADTETDGGYASPIVANGKVFLSYFTPAGEVLDPSVRSPRRQPVAARDVVLCVDAATGRTLWKRDLGEGINLHCGMKAGYHHTPCWDRGRVYAQSSLGRVYCLNDADGRSLWEADVPTTAAQKTILETRKRLRSQGQFPYRPKRDCPDVPLPVLYQLPLQVADGVVVADGGPLVAFATETGKELWQQPYIVRREVYGDRCDPLRWTVAGQESFIVGNRCLAPRTGAELWRIDEAEPGMIAAPTIGEGYVVYNGKKGPQCFAITPKGYERRWTAPTIKSTIGVGVIHNGWYYILSRGAQAADALYAVELATGKQLPPLDCGISAKILCISQAAMAGRLFAVIGRNDALAMVALAPARFGFVGEPRKFPLSGYTSPVLEDGRLYVRGGDSLYCYDLRKTGGKE